MFADLLQPDLLVLGSNVIFGYSFQEQKCVSRGGKQVRFIFPLRATRPKLLINKITDMPM